MTFRAKAADSGVSTLTSVERPGTPTAMEITDPIVPTAAERAVLKCLADRAQALTVDEMVELTQYSRTAVFRAVRHFASDLGLVHCDNAQSPWRYSLTEEGTAYQADVLDRQSHAEGAGVTGQEVTDQEPKEKKHSRKSPQKRKIDLRAKILELLKERGPMTAYQLRDATSSGHGTVYRPLNALIRSRKIVRRPVGKNGIYELAAPKALKTKQKQATVHKIFGKPQSLGSDDLVHCAQELASIIEQMEKLRVRKEELLRRLGEKR